MTLRAGAATLAGAAMVGCLLVAAPAAAKPCHPHHGGGNSEVAQYLETIPGSCADQPIGGNGSGDQGTSNGAGPGSNAAGLPPATISQLRSAGPSGSQAASFAESTATGSAGQRSSGSAGRGTTAGGAGSLTTSGAGGSLLDALEQLVTGNDASASGAGEGLGTWLPILLGLVLIGGLGVLAGRRSRTG